MQEHFYKYYIAKVMIQKLVTPCNCTDLFIGILFHNSQQQRDKAIKKFASYMYLLNNELAVDEYRCCICYSSECFEWSMLNAPPLISFSSLAPSSISSLLISAKSSENILSRELNWFLAWLQVGKSIRLYL